MRPDGRCTPAEFRARALLVALGLLGLAALGLACGETDTERKLRVRAEAAEALALYALDAKYACEVELASRAGAQPDGGAR